MHKKSLSVESTHVGKVKPHSEELLKESKAKLLEMAEKDKERIMLEESRNKVESYIYHIKNTISDKEDELSSVSTEEQREECSKLALAAQDWMDDEGYSADFATIEDKYASLSEPFEKIMLRLKEQDARPQAIEALKKRLTEIEQLMTKWETAKPHITEEERSSVQAKVEEVRQWIEDNEGKQAKKAAHEEPAFLSEDVPGQSKTVEALVMRLGRKPKPKPAKQENATAEETESNNNTEAGTEPPADAENVEKEEKTAEPEESDNDEPDL